MPLTPTFSFAHLEFLYEFVRRRKSDPTLSIEKYTTDREVATSTFGNRLNKIEDEIGTYLVVRRLDHSGLDGRRPAVTSFPEQTEEQLQRLREKFPGIRPKVNRQPDLTLDGQIWAAYAELVLELYELARRATERLPDAGEGVKAPSGPFVPFRVNIPDDPHRVKTRRSEADRRSFLAWIEHHRDAMLQAKAFTEQIDGSVFELSRLLPGYEPEEPPPFVVGELEDRSRDSEYIGDDPPWDR